MKKILSVMFVLLTTQAFAQENVSSDAAVATITANARESLQLSEPSWRFLIGKSSVKYGFDSNYYSGSSEMLGTGLTFGGAYDFNNFWSAGASYTNFKTEYNAYYSEGETVSIKSNLDFFTAYAELTPIRYSFGNVDFAGSLQVGMASRANQYIESSRGTYEYYGASATLSLNKQIGISLDTKVSKDFSSMNAISMVGYY